MARNDPEGIAIAVVNSKGGVSKTTLCANLAVHIAEQGEAITLIDLDGQGSLKRWHELRHRFELDTGNPEIQPDSNETLRTRVSKAKRGSQWVLMDCAPPVFETATPPVIRFADFIVIPATPSPLDLEASKACIEAVEKAGKPYCVVLTNNDPSFALAKSARGYFDRVAPGMTLAKEMTHSKAYVGAMIGGAAGSEYQTDKKLAKSAANEVKAIWAEIKKRIAGAT